MTLNEYNRAEIWRLLHEKEVVPEVVSLFMQLPLPAYFLLWMKAQAEYLNCKLWLVN